MLHLHPDASIVIYDDITIIEPAQRHVVTDNYREAAGTIAPLVGDDIVDCSVFESSSLRIKLQSEYEIIVNGDSDQHECFEFKSEDLSFVV